MPPKIDIVRIDRRVGERIDDDATAPVDHRAVGAAARPEHHRQAASWMVDLVACFAAPAQSLLLELRVIEAVGRGAVRPPEDPRQHGAR